jgi:glycerol-3-phosphate dehydrogenase
VPGLRTEHLRGGTLYYEAVTRGGRLAIAVLESAAAAGAVLCNHVAAVGARDGEVQLLDRAGGLEVAVRARRLVNAAGDGADAVRQALGVGGGERVRGWRASYLVLDPSAGEVGLGMAAGEAPAPLLVPRAEAVVFGPLAGEGGARDDLDAQLARLAPLLEAPPGRCDVRGRSVAQHAVAPPPGAGALAEERSAAGPLHTVVGAPLATHRAVAERLLARLGASPSSSPTRAAPLPGGDGPREVGDPLWWRHGSRAWRVRALAAADPSLLEPLCPHRPFLGAEALFALRAQGAVTPADVEQRLADLRGPCPEAECRRALLDLCCAYGTRYTLP